jgi:four helix bundle protein
LNGKIRNVFFKDKIYTGRMSDELKKRTKTFSLAIIELSEELGYSPAKKVVINQLLRSATSVGANYRAVTRARSDREFLAKLRIVLEEVDESCFWLEIIDEKNWINVKHLLSEANQLTAIVVKSIKTMNEKIAKNPNTPNSNTP